MDTHIATRKDHRCDVCERKIPIGARYFVTDEGSREHTNCLEFENQPRLAWGYNQNRSVGKARGES